MAQLIMLTLSGFTLVYCAVMIPKVAETGPAATYAPPHSLTHTAHVFTHH